MTEQALDAPTHVGTVRTRTSRISQLVTLVAVVVPPLGLASAMGMLWGVAFHWVDVALLVSLYVVCAFGTTIGFHRYFTHKGFEARAPIKVALAVLGCMTVQGPITQWVTDHRKHHALSDQEGDPHSPWRFGANTTGLLRGLLFAHCGWLFQRQWSNRARFAPDLLADRDITRVDRMFGPLVAVSLLAPPVIGGLLSWSWQGALTAFFWASLVRIALLHHVTWSINSICHVYGERPFRTRTADRAANFWPLALISFGESWHNSHHADPTCARHGVLPGQFDPSARLIWLLEKTGWVHHVRWPEPQRFAALRQP